MSIQEKAEACNVPYCMNGTLWDPKTDTCWECGCSIRKRLAASMDPEIRAVSPLTGHIDFITEHDLTRHKSGRRVMFRGSKRDFLCLCHFLQKHAFSGGIDSRDLTFELTSDQLILDRHRKYFQDAEKHVSPDELAVKARFCFIWLGTLTKGWENTCSLILDVLRLRDCRGYRTWLAFDPSKPLWLKESEGWDMFEGYLVDYLKLEIPAILSPPKTDFFALSDAVQRRSEMKVVKEDSGLLPGQFRASTWGKCLKCEGKIPKHNPKDPSPASGWWADYVGLGPKGKKVCLKCGDEALEAAK